MRSTFASVVIFALTLGIITTPASAAVISTSDDVSVFTPDFPEDTYVASGFAGAYALNGAVRDYLKFVLPSAAANTQITQATLLLSYNHAFAGSNNPLNVWSTTDSFSDSNISYAVQPGLGTLLMTFNPLTDGSIYSIDVTNYVNSEYLGDGVASLVLAAQVETWTVGTPPSWRYFNGGLEQLSITIGAAESTPTGVPEPASLTLLGLAVLGLGSIRRQRL